MLRIEREICCDYRTFINFSMIVLLFIFQVFWLFVLLCLERGIFLIFIAIPFLTMLYYILEMLHRKVILTDDKIIVSNFLGKNTVYNLCDISQIMISNHYKTKYLKIKVGKKKIIIQKHVRKYVEFRNAIGNLFGLKDYERTGTFTYDLNM